MGRRGGWFNTKDGAVTKCINKKTALAILRLFGACYHVGLNDAHDVGDDITCEDFIQEVRVPGVYGRVVHAHRMGESEWGFQIMTFIRNKATVQKTVLDFMRKIMDRNYLTCTLPLAQEFYIWGLKDYNAAPVAATAGEFVDEQGTMLARWTRKGRIRQSVNEILMSMQEFCFLRSRIDDENPDNKYAMKSTRYEWYSKAMWLALQ